MLFQQQFQVTTYIQCSLCVNNIKLIRSYLFRFSDSRPRNLITFLLILVINKFCQTRPYAASSWPATGVTSFQALQRQLVIMI